MSVFGVKSMVLNLLQEWNRMLKDKEVGHKIQPIGAVRKWSRPAEGWIKINTDAACKRGCDHIGIGCIVRNDMGSFVRARSSAVRGIFHPREAEAISLKEVLPWNKEWTNSKCIYETNSKFSVDAIYGTRGKSYFDTIMDDCVELFKHFEQVLVVFVPRSVNIVAHILAHVAYYESNLKELFINALEFIDCNLILEDY
ncbi:uncharacterized protein LOC141691236 [Apium graveolens]|uniref:uncharacterized protein LOC141691236 n=1 Tax=Apium graveolens TaxID=4045 RepID=UPI003D7BB7C9